MNSKDIKVMMTSNYTVLDTEGKFIKSFPSWSLADNYRNLMGRPDWSIKRMFQERQPTERQLNAVSFCEDILGIRYTGDRGSFKEVSFYLKSYLNLAKAVKQQQDEEEYIPEDLLADWDSAMG